MDGCISTHPYNDPTTYSYTLRFLRYSSDKGLKFKVTTESIKAESRSHYDIDHLHAQQMSRP